MSKSSPFVLGNSFCKVSIYTPTSSLPYYRISFRIGGRRLQRTRKSFSEAYEIAASIHEQLQLGRVSIAQITKQELATLDVAKVELDGAGIRIDQAIRDYAEARRRLGIVTLNEAVEYYLRNKGASLREIPLKMLVQDFLMHKKHSEVSDRYLKDLKSRLRSFESTFDGPVSKITAEDMAVYFRKLDFAPENHANQIRVVRTLLNYAKKQEYLPESVNLLKGVTLKKIVRANYLIYKPTEFQALLNSATDELLPPLVLLGYSGVRPNEMRRLTWADIRFETRTVIIDATKAKTASRRTVPLCERGIEWLERFKGAEGLIWSRKSDYWSKALNRLHRGCGIKQLPNGLRHSYISYRLTLTGDVNRTALEAGNSTAMIHRHYHALVDDPKLAVEWFEV